MASINGGDNNLAPLAGLGLTAKLQIVGFVVELSRALPSAIAGYGVITSPFGGVFRLDYAIVAVILFVADYLLTRASRRVR